jgi:hypothetical protein
MRLTPTIPDRLRTGICRRIQLPGMTRTTPSWLTMMNTLSGWIVLRCIRRRISSSRQPFHPQHHSSSSRPLPSGAGRRTTIRRLPTDLREPVFPSAPLPASPPDLI